VKGEYRRKGIEGLLYLESFKAAMRRAISARDVRSWRTMSDQRAAAQGASSQKVRLFEKRLV